MVEKNPTEEGANEEAQSKSQEESPVESVEEINEPVEPVITEAKEVPSVEEISDLEKASDEKPANKEYIEPSMAANTRSTEEVQAAAAAHEKSHEHSKKRKKSSGVKFNTKKWATAIIVLIILLFLIKSCTTVDEPTVFTPEIVLVGNACEDCIDLADLAVALNLGYSTTELSVEDASDYISKYNITGVPALLVLTEEELPLFNFEQVENGFLLQNIAPYRNLATDDLVGEVEISIIEAPNCDECFNITLFTEQIVDAMAVTKTTNVEATQDIINKYDLTRLPVVIVEGEVEEYIYADAIGPKVGNARLLEALAPYYDLATEEVAGLVEVTYIMPDECDQCNNESIYRDVLEQQGVFIADEKVLTQRDGRSRIAKYNITELPVMILSKEITAYDFFIQNWAFVGTVEEDGMLVLRKNEALGLASLSLIEDELVVESDDEATEFADTISIPTPVVEDDTMMHESDNMTI